MAAKTEEEMALAEKIDLARTLYRYKHRRQMARDLNEVEELIKSRHDAEVAAGSLVQIDIDSLGVGHIAKELPSGDNSGESASSEASRDKA